MLIIFAFLVAGFLCGYFLRRHRLSWTGKVTTVLIWILLLLLGVEVGCNRQLIGSLPVLGLEALLVALVASAGSCLMSMLLWRWICARANRGGGHGGRNRDETGHAAGDKESGVSRGAVVDSLVIVGFFIAGVMTGVSGILPVDLSDTGIAMYALYALIFSVGFGVGNNPDIQKEFRKLNPGLALLPLMTILGTLSATALLGLVLPGRTVAETLAVGSGFAYYSLSSVLITGYIGPELGTVALISNIIREFITLLAAPLLVRWFGPLAAISAGGATTMDVTLPAVVQASGEKYTVLSMYHGFVVDFSVPFLVTFFCSL